MIIAKLVSVAIIGYLLGSIPFCYLMGKLLGGVDVRQFGSGNTGGTNLLRTAGFKIAAAGAGLDVVKAILAVVFAGLLMGSDSTTVGDVVLNRVDAQALAAGAAVTGHIWTVFLNFKGGRGVATFYGGMLMLSFPAAVSSGIILLITAALTKYASLGSIVGATASYVILVTLVLVRGYHVEYLIYALFSAIVIILAHRDNIMRLISGKELRIDQKAKKRDLNPS